MGPLGDPLEVQSIFGESVRGTSNLKWKFLMLSTIFKLNCMPHTANRIFPVWQIALMFIAFILPFIYCLETFFVHITYEVDDSNYIFPYAIVFSVITPTIMSRFEFLFVNFLFLLITNLSFLYSFYYPQFCRHLKWIFNLEWHLIFIPLNSGSFLYCFYYLNHEKNQQIPVTIICLLVIVFFIFYMCTLYLATLTSSVSIIHPNPYLTSWFTPISPFLTFYLILISMAAFLMPRVTMGWRYSFLGICFIMSISLAVYMIKKQPLIFFPANDYIASALIINCLLILIIIMLYLINRTFSTVFFGTIPLFIFLVYFLVSKYSESRRAYYLELLKAPNQIENLSYEYLKDYFGYIYQEETFRMIIKVGLENGSKTVTNQAFVGYVLGRFPKSRWMIMYVNYLYSAVWGMDDDTFQYLIHLLSIDTLPLYVEIPLFESLYTYMQLTGARSPYIKNELKKFQEITIQFAVSYKQFWGNIIQNKDTLYKDISHVYMITSLGTSQMEKMLSLFPFSSDVWFHNSIFLADFKKDFKKASVATATGFSIFNNQSKFITNYLNTTFRPFFSGQIVEKKPDPKQPIDQYTFLSVAEHSADFAVRHPNHPVKDEYLKTNANAYTAQRNHLFHEAPFLNYTIKQMNYIMIFLICMFIGLVILSVVNFKGITSLDDKSVAIFKSMYGAVQFVDSVESLFYDVWSNYNISNPAFVVEPPLEIENPSLFIMFMRQHVKLMLPNINHFLSLLMNITQYMNVYDLEIAPDFSFLDNGPKITFYYLIDVFYEIILESLYNENFQIRISWGDFYKLRTSLIEGSLQFVKQAREECQQQIYLYTGKYLIIQVITVLAIWLVVIIIIIIIQVIIHNLKKKLYTIFRTLQTPIRQNLEKDFDKLISTKDPTICTPETPRTFPQNFWILLATFLVVLPNVVEIIIIAASFDYQVPVYYNESLKDTGISGYGYFSHAQMEYLLEGLISTPEEFDLVHNENTCVHNYFQRAKFMSFSLPFSMYLNSDWVGPFVLVCMTLSMLSLLYFIYCIYYLTRIFKATRYLLFSIPTKVGIANPILYRVIKRQEIISSEVENNVREAELKDFTLKFYGFNK